LLVCFLLRAQSECRDRSIEGAARVVNALEERSENRVEEVLRRSLASAIREVTLRRPSQRAQWFDPGYLFRAQAQERLFLKALTKHGLRNLAGCQILDVGCGFGYWLRRYRGNGALYRTICTAWTFWRNEFRRLGIIPRPRLICDAATPPISISRTPRSTWSPCSWCSHWFLMS